MRNEPRVLCRWDVLEILRRILLTSFVLFIPKDRSYIRLLVALFVTLLWQTVLFVVRPFRRNKDNNVAIVAQLSLVAVFTCTFVLKFHASIADESSEEAADERTGFDTTALVVVFSLFNFLMLAFVLVQSVREALLDTQTPTLRLKATGLPPELPKVNKFDQWHLMLSHAWSTGQDQAHNIARQLTLLMPSIEIWLDVDHLDDINRLEDVVTSSMAVLIFLSRGCWADHRSNTGPSHPERASVHFWLTLRPVRADFASRNRRRELYQALRLDKPLVLVYEADENKGGARLDKLKSECTRHCGAAAGTPAPENPRYSLHGATPRDSLLEEGDELQNVPDLIFTESRSVIQWVRVRDFQLVALRLIAAELLFQLKPRGSLASALRTRTAGQLAKALYLPGDIADKSLYFAAEKATVAYCPTNCGAIDVVERIRQRIRLAQPGAWAPLPRGAEVDGRGAPRLNRATDRAHAGRPGERTASEIAEALPRRCWACLDSSFSVRRVASRPAPAVQNSGRVLPVLKLRATPSRAGWQQWSAHAPRWNVA